MQNTHFFPPFATLLQQALGNLLHPQAVNLLEMMDEHIVFEFPYAPEGGVRKIVGKDNLTHYLSKISELFEIENMALSRSLINAERDTAVLEFTATGMLKHNSQPYVQSYISVIEIKNQWITYYKDYWNPLALTSSVALTQGANHDA